MHRFILESEVYLLHSTQLTEGLLQIRENKYILTYMWPILVRKNLIFTIFVGTFFGGKEVIRCLTSCIVGTDQCARV